MLPKITLTCEQIVECNAAMANLDEISLQRLMVLLHGHLRPTGKMSFIGSENADAAILLFKNFELGQSVVRDLHD